LPGFDINAMTKALGGMNLGPLTGMLNNINLTQLLPLVPTFMKMVGGSGGLGSLFNPSAGGGLGSLFNPGAGAGAGLNPGYYGGGYPVAAAPGAVAPAFIVPQHLQADPRFVVLGALKPFLPQDKGIMIDQIIKFLVLYLTISPILPKAPIRPTVPMTAPVVAAVQPSPKSEVPVNT
jgi:hypothetical protein